MAVENYLSERVQGEQWLEASLDRMVSFALEFKDRMKDPFFACFCEEKQKFTWTLLQEKKGSGFCGWIMLCCCLEGVIDRDMKCWFPWQHMLDMEREEELYGLEDIRQEELLTSKVRLMSLPSSQSCQFSSIPFVNHVPVNSLSILFLSFIHSRFSASFTFFF